MFIFKGIGYAINCLISSFLFMITIMKTIIYTVVTVFLTVFLGIIVHTFFSAIMGSGAAVIADTILFIFIISRCCSQENAKSSEYATVHPKPSGIKFTDIIIGFFLWNSFFGNDSKKE